MGCEEGARVHVGTGGGQRGRARGLGELFSLDSCQYWWCRGCWSWFPRWPFWPCLPFGVWLSLKSVVPGTCLWLQNAHLRPCALPPPTWSLQGPSPGHFWISPQEICLSLACQLCRSSPLAPGYTCLGTPGPFL